MKKIFIILLIVILAIVLIACEGGASEVGGDASEVGGDASEAGGDASEETIKLTWPKDKLPKSVPQLKGITITGIEDTQNGVTITFGGCDENKTKLYINQIKNAGWEFKTKNDESGKTVTASKEGESLIFISSDASGLGSISYSAD